VQFDIFLNFLYAVALPPGITAFGLPFAVADPPASELSLPAHIPVESVAVWQNGTSTIIIDADQTFSVDLVGGVIIGDMNYLVGLDPSPYPATVRIRGSFPGRW
jgi:hypothetical protein